MVAHVAGNQMTDPAPDHTAGFSEGPAPFQPSTSGSNALAMADGINALLQKLPYQAVEQGISASLLADIERQFLSRDEIRLVIPDRTLDRRIANNDPLKPSEVDGIARLLRVRKGALDLFENVRNADMWLHNTNPALGPEIPMMMARTDIGAREVETSLGRMSHGVCS